jgi:hypothetical protein
MGRPSPWIFWVAGAYTLAMALLGFGITMFTSDTNNLFWGTCLLLLAGLMGLALAYYALRSLRQLPPPPKQPDAP